MMEEKALHLPTPCWFSWLGALQPTSVPLCAVPLCGFVGGPDVRALLGGSRSVGVVRLQGDGAHLRRTGSQSSAAPATRP